MRVIGHVDHPHYKITIFHFNNRHTIKIEDGMLEQSYAYRDGSVVSSLSEAQAVVTSDFLQNCKLVFDQMKIEYKPIRETQLDHSDDDFDEII